MIVGLQEAGLTATVTHCEDRRTMSRLDDSRITINKSYHYLVGSL